MVQQVKAPETKSDDLSLVPGTHMLGAGEPAPTNVPWPLRGYWLTH